MILTILFVMVCGVLNWGYAYMMAFGVIAFAYPLITRRTITMNFLLHKEIWILICFGVLYAIGGGLSFTNIKYYLILPILAYMIGWESYDFAEKKELTIVNNIMAIALGFGLYAALNYFSNLGHNRYQLIDFWSKSFRAATGSGFLNTMVLAMLFYCIVFEKRRITKACLFASIIISSLYMLMLGTRTQMYILLIVFIASLIAYSVEHNNLKTVLTIFIYLAIVIALFGLLYSKNMFGLKTALLNSNMLQRFSSGTSVQSNSERWVNITRGIKSLYKYPFGGQKNTMYYHNLWLDINRVAGLAPMIMMLVFVGCELVHGYKVFVNQNIDSGIRYFVGAVFLAVFINFNFEPVLEGLLNFFLAFCVIAGITDAYVWSDEFTERKVS